MNKGLPSLFSILAIVILACSTLAPTPVATETPELPATLTPTPMSTITPTYESPCPQPGQGYSEITDGQTGYVDGPNGEKGTLTRTGNVLTLEFPGKEPVESDIRWPEEDGLAIFIFFVPFGEVAYKIYLEGIYCGGKLFLPIESFQEEQI